RLRRPGTLPLASKARVPAIRQEVRVRVQFRLLLEEVERAPGVRQRWDLRAAFVLLKDQHCQAGLRRKPNLLRQPEHPIRSLVSNRFHRYLNLRAGGQDDKPSSDNLLELPLGLEEERRDASPTLQFSARSANSRRRPSPRLTAHPAGWRSSSSPRPLAGPRVVLA